MARPDEALVLVGSGDIVAGLCVCVFHPRCGDMLERGDGEGGCKMCSRCLAVGKLEPLTNRNCLRCGQFAVMILCGQCEKILVTRIEGDLKTMDGVELRDSVLGLDLTLRPHYLAACVSWIHWQVQCRADRGFILCEGYARSRAWALIELWRLMLVGMDGIVIRDWHVGFGLDVDMERAQNTLARALAMLPIRGLFYDETRLAVRSSQKNPFLHGDGVFVLGRDLASGGLLGEMMGRRDVGRYYVPGRNDYVFYVVEEEKERVDEPDLLELWKVATICAGPG